MHRRRFSTSTTSSSTGVRPCDGWIGKVSPNGHCPRSCPGGDERSRSIRNSNECLFIITHRCFLHSISSQARRDQESPSSRAGTGRVTHARSAVARGERSHGDDHEMNEVRRWRRWQTLFLGTLLAVLLMVPLTMGTVSALSWNNETVDTAYDVGHFSSLALDTAGNPRIGYWTFGMTT